MADPLNSNGTTDNGAIVPNGGAPNTGTPLAGINNSGQVTNPVTPAAPPLPTQNYNAFDTPPVPSSIDTSNLGANPVQVPTPPPDNTNSFVNSLVTGNPQQGLPSEQTLGQGVDKAQGNIDQTTQQIQDLLTQLGYKASDTASLQESANIPGLTNQLSDLNNQLAQKKADYAQQFQNIGAQNIPSLFVTGQLAIAKAAAASDLGATAAQVQAAQGNITTALNTIDKTIQQKYQPILDNIDQQTKFYQLNKDQLSTAQAKLATRQQQVLDVQKQAITNEQGLVSQAQKDMTAQINAGVDKNVAFQAMGQLLNKKINIGDFYKAIGLPQQVSQVNNQIVQNTMSLMGATSDVPVKDAISNLGMDKITQALIQQEGGTPQGTNNPGNIKFANQPGATMGKPATDGGNFANFDTTNSFQNAITAMVQKAADSGQNLSQFIASYKGIPNTSQGAPGTTGSNTVDSTTQGYSTQPVSSAGGITQAAIDQAALQYAMTGKMPSIGLGSTGMAAQKKNAIMNRAAELGNNTNIAGNEAQLKSLTGTLGQQTDYLNTTQRAYNTAQDNLKVITQLVSDNGLNQSDVPIINQIQNAVKSNLTDPGTVAAFQSGLAGLRSEYSQVLAKGGVRSVETDNAAAKLIPDNLSPTQLQQVTTQLGQEGGNAIKEAQDQVSAVNDQINGILSPKSSATDSGTTTLTYSDGKQYSVPNGKVADALKNGWTQ